MIALIRQRAALLRRSPTVRSIARSIVVAYYPSDRLRLSIPFKPGYDGPTSDFDPGENSMSEYINNVSDSSFEQDVLQADGPVLVDYWAEWCGPCKMIAPVLDEIAKEYEGKLKVCKLNIDENQETPPKYGVRGIPTLMLFKNGNVEATKVGALSKSQLAAFLDSNI
jgi:thioredoxin 1